MKSFKHFHNIYFNKHHNYKFDYIPASHGSHSLTTKEKEEFKIHKAKVRKLAEGFLKTENYDTWLNKNDNEHLGTIKDEEDRTQINKLHELHGEPSAIQKDAFENYTSDSSSLNNELINAHKEKREPRLLGAISTKALDMSSKPAKTKLKTYSGVNFNLEDIKPVGKSESGNAVYKSPAYLSSSVSKPVAAKDFAEFHANKGRTHVPTIIQQEIEPEHHISVIGNHSSGPEEQEVLHPRGMHYEHIGTTHLLNADGSIAAKVHHFKPLPNYNSN